mmetsp:Transcript_35391/g.100205  ORF Transcript_35391/g.100205 Transcript_35391/m.100205 type:complete len:148 (-) Transcript_35391:128-571(-)
MQVKAVVAEVTLAKFASVEEFTEALQGQFRSKVASATGVPSTQVVIVDLSPGSVVVRTAIVLPSKATDQEVQGVSNRLANEESPIVPQDIFGPITVVLKDIVVVDDIASVKSDLTEPPSGSSAGLPVAGLLRITTAAAALTCTWLMM